jgi:tetratricopeptide (TPR) repeat protein/predicted RNA methylase
MTELDIDVALSSAFRHLEVHGLDAAAELCDDILAKCASPVAMHLRGLIAHRQGSRDISEKLIRKAIEIDPLNSTYHASLAWICAARGQSEEARAEQSLSSRLRNVSKIAQDVIDRLYESGQLLAASAVPPDYAAAVAPGVISLERIMSGDLVAGQALLERGDWWEALNTFRNAVFREASAPALSGLALALINTGAAEDAIKRCRQALEQDPSFQPAYVFLALAQLTLRDYDEAAESCRLALGLAASTDAMELSAMAEAGRRQWAAAERALGEILLIRAVHPHGHAVHAILLHLMGRDVQGLAAMRTALTQHVGDIFVAIPLGLANQWLRLLRDLALQSIAAPLENPNAAGILQGAGVLLTRLDYLREGVRIFERVANADPNNANVRYDLAQAYRDCGLIDDAIKAFQDAIDLGRTDDAVRLALAELLAARVRKQQERRARQQVKYDSVTWNTADLQAIRYQGITVFYTRDLVGGGIRFEPAYRAFLEKHFSRRRRLFEWCAGPGFLGFSMLAHGVCETLCVADINPKAVDMLQRTVVQNRLSDRVGVYLSDCLDDIPEAEEWDLVISNPPQYANFYGAREIDRLGMDKDWAIHRRFYEKVANHLAPDGALVILEWSDPRAPGASTVEDFREMIEGNGLRIIASAPFPGIPYYYYIWSGLSAERIAAKLDQSA